MKRILILSVVFLTVVVWPGHVFAETPNVIKSTPDNGATDVAIDVGRIIIVFDQNMKMNSWSLTISEKGPFPPMIQEDEPWIDPLTFELRVKRLKPKTTYFIQLNSKRRKGFMSAEDQTPLPVTTITFTTASEERNISSQHMSSKVGGQKQADAVLLKPGERAAVGEKQEKAGSRAKKTAGSLPVISQGQSDIRPDWRFSVTRSSGMKGLVKYQTGDEEPFRFFLQTAFTDQVVKAQGTTIHEVLRQATKAEINRLDIESGQMVKEVLVSPGKNFRVVHSSSGSVIYDSKTHEELWDENLVDLFSSSIISRLWPDGQLSEGQTWSYEGVELARRIALIEAKGGQINLRVDRIAREPSSGLMTAQLRGRLHTTIDFNGVPLKFDAQVEIDLPLAIGVPFMTKFTGKLSGQGTTQDQQGQPVNFHITADGDVLQICKPSESVMRALQETGNLEEGQKPLPAGTDTPIKKNDQGRAYGNSTISAPVKASKGKAGRQTENIFLKLYQEQYQRAFHMLIPKGWKTEGGMIPSGVQWNVVDLVENNIRFRVTSPDGKSYFGWYPRFYFQDPAVHMQSSGGLLRPKIGGVLNGCWIYPYMGVAQYVQQIIFGQLAAQEFQNPRIIGRAVESPELRPWLPQMAQRKECGYVNFECTIRGTPMYGRIYTLVYDLGSIWSTVGTFGWIAPKSRWKEDERVMELCIRSFRLNPQWVRRAAAAQQKRGKKYGEVIREMQGIDNEINRNRSQTRSDIQEEFYKVITGQIETFDPETGNKKMLPMYNNAWTNGRGDYVLKDYDDGTLPVEDPTEWRKLKIINRNDPNYRPEKYGD